MSKCHQEQRFFDEMMTLRAQIFGSRQSLCTASISATLKDNSYTID